MRETFFLDDGLTYAVSDGILYSLHRSVAQIGPAQRGGRSRLGPPLNPLVLRLTLTPVSYTHLTLPTILRV